MTNAVANVLMSISTSHANHDANAMQCNATQYIATVCALGASDSNDQQYTPSQNKIGMCASTLTDLAKY